MIIWENTTHKFSYCLTTPLITQWTLRHDWLVTKFVWQNGSDIPINCTTRDALIPLKSRAKTHIDLAKDVFGLIEQGAEQHRCSLCLTFHAEPLRCSCYFILFSLVTVCLLTFYWRFCSFVWTPDQSPPEGAAESFCLARDLIFSHTSELGANTPNTENGGPNPIRS